MKAEARIGIDIGGTFTDVALEIGARAYSTKVLTTHAQPEAGVLDGLEAIMRTSGCTPGDVALIIHGTTLATNALIERKGAVTGLLTTEGFRDVLEIRSEDRYEQYDLSIEMPPPLVSRQLRLGVAERLDAQGEVRIPLDEGAVRDAAAQFAQAGVEAVAVGFLHSYVNGAHERRAAAILAEALPGVAISMSHEVAPEMREYERFSTAAANAYVQPLIAGYLDRLARRLGAAGYGCPLLLMLSGGGLTNVETAKRFPVRLVESGPAGGAAFAADVARRHGIGDVLSFDMGGTTAKLCLIDNGSPQTSRSFEVARVWRFARGSGLPLRIPVVEMVEIGAGGGSLASVDALGRIAVGPQSAGSEPGPACYGRGGTGAAVTDADVQIGRIDAEDFAGGAMRLDAEAACAALAERVGAALSLTPDEAALGVVEMVEETMASAARVHAIEQGADVAARAMVAFGGAGPVHALRMATKLGIGRVLIPARAGVGSAVGFLRAPIAYQVMRSRHIALADLESGAIEAMLAEAEAEARTIVTAATDAQLATERSAFMRYIGQGHEIEVALPPPGAANLRGALQAAFEAAYRAIYGSLVPGGRIEAMAWSVNVREAAGPVSEAVSETVGEVTTPAPVPAKRRAIDPATGAAHGIAVWRREDLAGGVAIAGPAVVVEDETSLYLPAGWQAQCSPDGAIDCRVVAAEGGGPAADRIREEQIA